MVVMLVLVVKTLVLGHWDQSWGDGGCGLTDRHLVTAVLIISTYRVGGEVVGGVVTLPPWLS